MPGRGVDRRRGAYPPSLRYATEYPCDLARTIPARGGSNGPNWGRRYSLVVTFESVNKEVKIYDDLTTAMSNRRLVIEWESEGSNVGV